MPARTERRANHNGPGMLAGAIAVLAGAVLVQGLPVLPPRWLDALLAVFALASFCACLRWRKFAWLWVLPLVVGAFAWTAWRADLAMQARLPHALEKQDILVTGTVTDLPQAQDGSTRFEFNIARAEFDGRACRCRDTYVCHGMHRAGMTCPPSSRVRHGVCGCG